MARIRDLDVLSAKQTLGGGTACLLLLTRSGSIGPGCSASHESPRSVRLHCNEDSTKTLRPSSLHKRCLALCLRAVLIRELGEGQNRLILDFVLGHYRADDAAEAEADPSEQQKLRDKANKASEKEEAAMDQAISSSVLRPLIASMATQALNSGLWVRRLLNSLGEGFANGGSPLAGAAPRITG
jgi:hypothetical protein